MPVVDYLLNSLIKRLQKTVKEREKKRKKRQNVKRSALKKKKSPRKKVPTKKRVKHKALKPKKKKPSKPTVKKVKRKSSPRPKSKAKKVKKSKPKIIPKVKSDSKEKCIGEVTHYFSRIQVIVLKMTHGKLLVSDSIRIKGRGRDFTQKVKSLQIESVDVKVAKKGQLVGLKVGKVAKPGDKVFKLDK